MKPILNEGEYLLSFYDEQDNEMHQQLTPNLTTANDIAKDKMQELGASSYRLVRCLINSKYNKWSPNK